MGAKSGRMLIGPGRPYDLIAICLLVAVAVLLPFYQVYGPLTWGLGFVAVFFAPGYAIVSALFPGQREVLARSNILHRQERIFNISMVERAALSFGLSASAVALIGTVLTRGVLDLTAITVAYEVAGLTYAFSAIAVYRRSRLPPGDQFLVKTRPRPVRPELNKAERSVAVVIAVAVVLMAVVTVNGLRATPAAESFTEFYINGADGNMEHLPQMLQRGQQGLVKVGAISHLGHSQSMIVTLHLENGTSTTSFDPSQPVTISPGTGRSTTFTLADGLTWERDITFTISTPGQWTLYITLFDGTEEKTLWMPLTVT